MSMDLTEMQKIKAYAEERHEKYKAAYDRTKFLKDGKTWEEWSKMLRDRVLSNPAFVEKYSRRKSAAANYSEYATINNGRMSKYSMHFLCK